MKIVITGNMGYVGPCLVRHLRAAYPDAVLVGVDMGYFAGCLTGAETLPECGVDIQYFADIRKIPDLALADLDAVVHLAAISNDIMGFKFESVTTEINYRATVALAKRAKAAGARSFVHASSCSMYGSADDLPRRENSPLNPLTAYARSKVASEKALKELADAAFVVTSLRFGTACGMSDRLRLDLVLNDFVAAAVATRKIEILSDGTPWRPLIDTKDMARAIDWAVHRQAACGGDYLAINVGSNAWNFQVKQLAEAVAMTISDVEITINANAQPDKRSYRVDFGLFRKLAPGYQPLGDLNATIADLRTGLESMGFNDPDFRNSKFMRLKVLTDLQNRHLLNDRLEWSRRKTV